MHLSRRRFLGSVGRGMLVGSLGPSLAADLAVFPWIDLDPALDHRRPSGGHEELEELVRAMQHTAAPELQESLVARLRQGTKLQTLVAAGALANARSLAGTDYEGYHAFMALMPAWRMARVMPEQLRPLPVLKVLFRNTARIRTVGGPARIRPLQRAEGASTPPTAEQLRALARNRDLAAAEAGFARACDGAEDHGFNHLLWLVQDDADVHRTVLPWRAFEMLQLTGVTHAETLLRQSVRYCVENEIRRVQRKDPEPEIRRVLPRALDAHGLLDKDTGREKLSASATAELAVTVAHGSRADAAEAVAQALAKGVDPEVVGEALSLAANTLLLHNRNDPRRRDGVYGAGVGVHASDAANAWRHIARTGDQRTRVTSLVAGAYHTAGQWKQVDKEQLGFVDASEAITAKDPAALLKLADGAIRERDQVGACAAIHRYGELGHPPKAAIDLMLGYAVSEDGALHAEKYFQTAVEEFGSMRPEFRWRQLIALARVTASEFGEPAPGQRAARKLLGV